MTTSEMILNYAKSHPDAKPGDVAKALAAKGQKVTPTYVSTVLSTVGRKKRNSTRRGRRGKNAAANADILANLAIAKNLTDKMGGIDQARKVLDTLALVLEPSTPVNVMQDEEALGSLAMRFRSTRDVEVRQSIAEEYAVVVNRLVQSNRWHEFPSPEDQLPRDWMPKAFLDYWTRR